MRLLSSLNPTNPTRLILILALFVLLLTSLFAPTAESTATNEQRNLTAGTLSIAKSDENSFAFELTPPLLGRSPVLLSGAQFERLTMPGYGNMRIPGRPDLPQTSFYVALPPGAVPSLIVRDLSAVEIANVEVMPGARQMLANPNYGNLATFVPEFETVFEVDEETYRLAGPYPESGPLSMDEPTWLRDQRVVQIWVRPVSANPAGDSIQVFDRISAELVFTYPQGSPALVQPRPESASYERVLQNTIVNYDEARDWRTPRDLVSLLPENPCLGGNAFRLTLERAGMYKLTYGQLETAGLSGPIASDSIRMCYEDQEISIRLKDGGDGTFGSGDSIIFYGEAVKTQETTTNVYWFTYGGSNHPRMVEKNEGANSDVPPDYGLTLTLEEDHVYRAEAPMTDVNDHWYWATLQNNEDNDLITIPFTFKNKSSASYDVRVQVEVYGRFGVPIPHKFEVRLNGQSVGVGEFTGNHNTGYLFDETIDAAALNEGNNEIAIEVQDVNGTYFYLHVNYVDMTARREFIAENDRLLFGQPASGNWRYEIGGFSGSAEAYNVTDPNHPVYLQNAGGSGTVTFSEDINAPAQYAVSGTSNFRTPLSVTKDSPSHWREPNWADYIIITDPLFDAALEPLRQKRTADGLKVKTVFVQDLFDEFGYGRYSPDAIADFLAYAYAEWDNDGAAPPPTYALLVGEGSYDHRNINGENGPGSNLVPVYLVSGIDSNIGETTGDNRYVAFNAEGGDTLAQMELGRLPVKDTAELSTVIDKILAYEAMPYDAGYHAGHFFVADNAFNGPRTNGVCSLDPAGDFFATANNFIPAHVEGYGQAINRLYWAPAECFPNPDSSNLYDVAQPYWSGFPVDMQTRMIGMFSAGQHFVTYIGHSGTLQWGKTSESFITAASIPSLQNGERTSIMLPMTCLEGLYHFPEAQFQSVSERLLRSPVGGAVASYAPTGLQVQTAHDFLLSGFYDGLFEGGAQTLGSAVMDAKINLDQNGSTFYQDLQDTFMLLGDPAMKIKLWHGIEQLHLPVMMKP